MNQPLSSATRPLTYRARFIETQRSTLTLSRISLSLLPIFLPPPPLSSEVNKELFQRDVRSRGGCFVCICIYARYRARGPLLSCLNTVRSCFSHLFHQLISSKNTPTTDICSKGYYPYMQATALAKLTPFYIRS